MAIISTINYIYYYISNTIVNTMIINYYCYWLQLLIAVINDFDYIYYNINNTTIHTMAINDFY